jgi:protein-S-isoprenylcysteine O-methyltransferase Ste14
MSDEALTELVRIHADARDWTDRMSRRTHPLWERIAMDLIVIFFFASTALMVFGTNIRLVDHLTGVAWLIAGIFAALVIFFVVQLTRSQEKVSPKRLRESLATPLFLGAASVVVGFAGTGISMYRALMRMVANPEHAAPIFARAFLSATATFAVAMLVTLSAGVVWFILAGRVARSEDAAAQTFLGVS